MTRSGIILGGSLCVLAAAGLATGISALQPQRDVPPFRTGDIRADMDAIHSLQNEYDSAPAGAARFAFLKNLAQEGEMDYRRGDDPRQLRLKMAAIGLNREGYELEAEKIYQRLLDRAVDPLDIATRAGTLGGMYRDRAFAQRPAPHWEKLAIEHLQLVVDSLTDPSVKIPSGSRELEFAVSGLDNVYRLQKNWAGIIQAQSIILDPRFAGNVSPEARPRALRSLAIAHKELGDSAGAVAFYDQLLSEFPDLGMDDGSRIRTLRARASALDPTRSSDAYLAALQDIWIDPAFRRFPEIADVGNEITRVYEDRELFDFASAMGEEVVRLILEMEKTWPVPSTAIETKRARNAFQTALSRTMHSAAKNEDYALAHWAATMYARRFDTPQSRVGAHQADIYERKYLESLDRK